LIITKNINMDLWIRERVQEVPAVQGDAGTRKVAMHLFANREPWIPGEDVSAAIRYCKPDGTGGTYDTMPDGEKAWEQSENTVSFLLAPQMLTVPGRVEAQVEILCGENVVASFPFCVLVEKNVAAGVVKSSDYFNVAHWLGGKLEEKLREAKESGSFDGKPGRTPLLRIGTVTTVDADAAADATIGGTAEEPILHLALPKGQDAQVDATLSISGQAADAEAVGAALAGKAPAGFGLGDTCVRVENWNDAVQNGYYFGQTNSPDGSWWYGYVVRDNASPRVTQTVFREGIIATRTGEVNSFPTWEWVNPPMTQGVEYRTTERHEGKVVYKRKGSSGLVEYRLDGETNWRSYGMLYGLNFHYVQIQGGGSVRFRIDSYMLMMCRCVATTVSSAAVYAFMGYHEFRAPAVTELSVGSSITISTGGDDTNGWFIEVHNNHSMPANMHLIGSCIPTFL